MIFDSHAHYDDKAFDADRDELLGSLANRGIEAIVNSGASIRSTEAAIQLAEEYANVYAAVGVHPECCGEMTEEHVLWLKNLLSHPKAVALGEIGLDYYWDEPDRAIQKEWFIRQLHLAKEVKKPVVIHSRDAAKDTLDIMRAEYGAGYPAYIHCFSYAKEVAREFLDMGCMFGIGGVVTFKNAKKVKETVAYLPMDRLLLETDCPYLAPVPYRGERNESSYLKLVAQEIADIKGITAAEVEEITKQNARRFFGL